MINRSIGDLQLYMQSLIKKRLLSKDQEVRRENDLKTENKPLFVNSFGQMDKDGFMPGSTER